MLLKQQTKKAPVINTMICIAVTIIMGILFAKWILLYQKDLIIGIRGRMNGNEHDDI